MSFWKKALPIIAIGALAAMTGGFGLAGAGALGAAEGAGAVGEGALAAEGAGAVGEGALAAGAAEGAGEGALAGGLGAGAADEAVGSLAGGLGAEGAGEGALAGGLGASAVEGGEGALAGGLGGGAADEAVGSGALGSLGGDVATGGLTQSELGGLMKGVAAPTETAAHSGNALNNLFNAARWGNMGMSMMGQMQGPPVAPQAPAPGLLGRPGGQGGALSNFADASPADTELSNSFLNHSLVNSGRQYANSSNVITNPSIINSVKPGHNYAKGGALASVAGGQDDVVPINAAPGEYVMDADTVSALGDGDNSAGAKKLDAWRVALREHKRSAPPDKIPPRAKNVGAYF